MFIESAVEVKKLWSTHLGKLRFWPRSGLPARACRHQGKVSW